MAYGHLERAWTYAEYVEQYEQLQAKNAKLVEACRETEEALIRFRAVNGKEYPDWQSLDWNFPARLTQIQAALAEGD